MTKCNALAIAILLVSLAAAPATAPTSRSATQPATKPADEWAMTPEQMRARMNALNKKAATQPRDDALESQDIKSRQIARVATKRAEADLLAREYHQLALQQVATAKEYPQVR